MIRVYLRTARSGERHQELATRDPVEAEARYLRLVRDACLGDVVIVEPGRGDRRIEPAEYHRNGPLEGIESRRLRLWSCAAEWTGPTPEQLRGLVRASGMSGAAVARALDVPIRTWHSWKSGDARRRIPYATWVAAMHVTGMMPPGELVSPLATGGGAPLPAIPDESKPVGGEM